MSTLCFLSDSQSLFRMGINKFYNNEATIHEQEYKKGEVRAIEESDAAERERLSPRSVSNTL